MDSLWGPNEFRYIFAVEEKERQFGRGWKSRRGREERNETTSERWVEWQKDIHVHVLLHSPGLWCVECGSLELNKSVVWFHPGFQGPTILWYRPDRTNHIPLQSGAADCVKGFVKCFLRVHNSLGCTAAQASKGNFQKKNFNNLPPQTVL